MLPVGFGSAAWLVEPALLLPGHDSRRRGSHTLRGQVVAGAVAIPYGGGGGTRGKKDEREIGRGFGGWHDGGVGGRRLKKEEVWKLVVIGISLETGCDR